MTNYRVVSKGVYSCAKCQAIFAGAFAKQDVLQCYRQHQEAPAKGYNSLPYIHRKNNPRNPLKKKLAEYNRAMKKGEHLAYKYSPDFFFAEVEGYHWNKHSKKKRRPSPLQSLAWGFYQHNWEQVKHAAYMLAYDLAVKQRLEGFQQEVNQVKEKFEGLLSILEENPAAAGHETIPLELDLDELNMN
ncbi:hypothetical protein ACFLVH_00550 [Chloroflexota bacterium]